MAYFLFFGHHDKLIVIIAILILTPFIVGIFYAKSIFYSIILLSTIIGIGSFLSFFFVIAVQPKWLNAVNLPIANPSGIVVADDGDIYAASAAFGRIARYTANGRFVGAWYTPTSGGSLKMVPSADGSGLSVCAIRLGVWHRYDFEGRYLAAVSGSPCKYSTVADIRFNLAHRIALVGPFFYPRILKLDALGRQRAIVQPPLYGITLTHPVVGWLLAFMAGLTASLVNWCSRILSRLTSWFQSKFRN